MANDIDPLYMAPWKRVDVKFYEDETINYSVFRRLQQQWPGGFFQVMGDEWEVGRKLAEGTQAEIFEAEHTLPDGTKEKWVLKTFKDRIPLQELVKMLPVGMLTNLGPKGYYSNGHSCSICGGMLLQDGRFAILLKRYWGDLRQLIDLKMQLNNGQGPPFSDMSTIIQIILDIALGMQALHNDGILHRDLKASNVFIWPLKDDYDPIHGGKFICHVADFEVSIGVLGTGFWRAPEIFLAFMNGDPFQITQKSDVYSFAMTCYEILTGRLPFEDLENTFSARYDIVYNHKQPKIP